jgi:hypothetical protein
VGDARGRVRYVLRLGDYEYCSVADARAWGEALAGCTDADDVAHTFLIAVRTGRVRKLAVRGFPQALGRHWIQTLYQPPGCDRCATVIYTNRHTLREHRQDTYDERERDLDHRRPRQPPGNSRRIAYDGKRWIETSDAANPERLWLRAAGRRRLVGTCRSLCFVVALQGPHVSYADLGARHGGTLHALDLRTGVRHACSFPRRSYRHERPLVVCGTPALVSETYRGTLRLWRPPHARSRC